MGVHLSDVVRAQLTLKALARLNALDNTTLELCRRLQFLALRLRLLEYFDQAEIADNVPELLFVELVVGHELEP